MAVTLADDLRRRAEEHMAAAQEALDATPLTPEMQTLLLATVAYVKAFGSAIAADILEYHEAMEVVDENVARRRKIMELNDGIRRNAARGDWAAVDKLVDEFYGGTIGGSGEGGA